MSGFSKARLAHLRDTMTGYVERGEVPGLVTAVSRRGETHVDAIGVKTIGGDDAMRADTIFRIASMTKPVVTVAAMILIEECKLRLDEPIDRWLPELGDRRVLTRIDGPIEETVPAKRPISVRDLLTFRSGYGLIMGPSDTPIQRAIAEAGMMPSPLPPSVSSDQYMARLGRLPPVYQPGERWMYHTSADVLGVLIARASGQTLEVFLRERIFAPLGMADTSFSVPAAKADRLASCYQINAKTGVLDVFDGAKDSRWSRAPAFQSGGGGLVSTIDDYLIFGQMMLNHGKLARERILSRPSVEAMIADQLSAEQRAAAGMVLGENRSWGFGVAVYIKRDGGSAVPGRYGWDGGCGTSWSSDPKENMVGVLLSQVLWSSPQPPRVYLDFWTSAYQAIDD